MSYIRTNMFGLFCLILEGGQCLIYVYMNKTEKLTNNKHKTIKMNKVWKAIAIVGNLSEVIIATTMVADLFNKIRGSRKATSTTIVVEDTTPQPEQPMAA